jgi:hypothetical protein
MIHFQKKYANFDKKAGTKIKIENLEVLKFEFFLYKLYLVYLRDCLTPYKIILQKKNLGINL